MRLHLVRRPRLASGLVSLIALAWASFAGAAPARLTLPLYDPAAGQTQVPAYAAQKFEIKLATPVDRARLLATARTGRGSVDALLDRFRVLKLEPEFAGSRDPNLSSYYIVHLPAGVALAEAVGAFRAEPEVEAADPIAILPVAAVPNDSLFQYQYGFYQANDKDSDLPEAWDLTQGDTSIVLAIVDTGVLWTHPDLAQNIWRNWGEIPGNGIDDDGNGFVDDVRGWDFVDGVIGSFGEDVNTPDNDPSDYAGHGTAVAGIAGAVVNNISGVAGAGYHCRIMALRAGWETNSGSVVDMSFCAQAIQYATDNGAKVINCSWQNLDQNGLGAAVSYAIAHGVTVVVAAGNEGTSTPPQNDLGQRGDCVDVAALDANDVRTTVSNFGPWVDVSAAGNFVITTGSAHYTPTYTSPGGTSFAAPLVTGIVGLYQSWRHAHGLPYAPPDTVRWRLHDTADNVDAANPVYAGKLGGGRVNAYRMLTDPPTSFFVPDPSPVSASPLFLDWGGSAQTIVFGDQDGRISAVDGASGAMRAGWPVQLGGTLEGDPAAWDVDFDGSPEVIAGTGDGLLHALHPNGLEAEGWPKSYGGPVRLGPAVGNVSGTPAFEMVFSTSTPYQLHVVDRFGTELAGWPKSLFVNTAPALADLDHDGVAEIVVGTTDSLVRVYRGDGSVFPGWPVKLAASPVGSPAIGDFDDDGQPDIVIATSSGLVYALTLGGSILSGFPVSTGGAMFFGPALADLDGDGKLEAVAGSANGKLYAWHGNGLALSGWPVNLGAQAYSPPAIAAVTGDGTLEVAVADLAGNAHLLRANGTEVPGWPRATGTGVAHGGPTLGDPDGDGHAEYLTGGDHFSCWDLGPNTYDASRRPWYTAGRSFLREGNVTLPAIGVGPPPPGPRHLALVAGANPWRRGDALRFTARGEPGAALEIGLFDAAGRRVAAEELSFGSEGTAAWAPRARALEAGVYFVAARSQGERISQKFVLLP